MKKIFILISLFICIYTISNAQSKNSKNNKVQTNIIDEKKLDKARSYISQGVKEKNSTKKNDLLRKATDIFKEMKMIKEGAIMIGDAFYSDGDLQSASRWYAKGGKDSKKELNKKVGEAYIEDAFNANSEKESKKAMTKAIQSLTKSVGVQEAYRIVGNEYFDMGIDNYPKAIEYYEKANYSEGIIMIADLYATNNSTKKLAAETYIKTKDKKGFKKAGDLFFNSGDYIKAMDYYAQGGVIEGYVKYASELRKAGRIDQMNTVYNVIADSLIANGTPDEVYTYALTAEKESNYSLASSLYSKLKDNDLSNKYKAYQLMSDLNYIEAKQVFSQMGKLDLSDAIDMNINQLTNLQQYKLSLDEFKRNEPKLTVKEDPTTGKLGYDQRDVALKNQYYSNPVNINGISEIVYKISSEYKKIKGSMELKDLVRNSFLKYLPVKNILDSNNFSINVSKQNLTQNIVTF